MKLEYGRTLQVRVSWPFWCIAGVIKTPPQKMAPKQEAAYPIRPTKPFHLKETWELRAENFYIIFCLCISFCIYIFFVLFD